MADNKNIQPRYNGWLLADSKGRAIVDFKTFISMNVQASGKVVSVPLESGLFCSFNKVQSPTRIQVMLGCQGEPDELQKVINKLTILKKEATTFSLVSPEQEYKDLTLESYNFSRKREEGVNVLYVTLNLVQIAPMEPDYSNKKQQKKLEPKNLKKPDAADKVSNIGGGQVFGSQSLGDLGSKNPLSSVGSAISKLQSKVTGQVFDQLKSSVTNLANIPNQLQNMVLDNVNAQIHAFQRGGNLFTDIIVDGKVVSAGQICKNGVNLLKGAGLNGIAGNLSFIDTNGNKEPNFKDLGIGTKLVHAVEDKAKTALLKAVKKKVGL